MCQVYHIYDAYTLDFLNSIEKNHIVTVSVDRGKGALPLTGLFDLGEGKGLMYVNFGIFPNKEIGIQVTEFMATSPQVYIDFIKQNEKYILDVNKQWDFWEHNNI